jgi:uncharacterized RDD family membrane protein YckC
MQTISVGTTQNVSIQHPVASVGDRILAYLLDGVILVAYLIAVIAVFINLNVETMWLWIIFVAIPIFLYHLTFEIFMNGQTPGKRVMNIQVVRLDGTQPTIGDYMLRWVFGLIDFYILSGALAVIIIATTGRGQRLGDIVAGTCVVKLVAHREISAEKVFISTEETYKPLFPQVIQLESQDIELIQRALEANQIHGNSKPVLMVTEKLKTLLGIQTDLPPMEFLYTLVKDYNHLNSR